MSIPLSQMPATESKGLCSFGTWRAGIGVDVLKGREAEPEEMAEMVESSARCTLVLSVRLLTMWLLCGDITQPHPESTSQSTDFPLAESALVEDRRAALADVVFSPSELSPLLSDLLPSVTTDVLPAFVLLHWPLLRCLGLSLLNSCLFLFKIPAAM